MILLLRAQPLSSAPIHQNALKIIFIPGLDLTSNDYGTIVTNLHKRGYQIISYNPTYRNTDNYQDMVTVWTKDIEKLANGTPAIIIGHSVGGAVAVHFCSISPYCLAGINLDGNPAYDEKIPVPFLYLQADPGSYCDQSCLQSRHLMEQITQKSGTQIVRIVGIKHYNFTDRRDQSLYDQDYLGPLDGRYLILNQINNFLSSIQSLSIQQPIK